jgi:hypothetical protein
MGAGNRYTLFALGVEAIDTATRSEPGASWALQHRMPEGRTWVEIGRFGSRALASHAIEAFVATGHGDAKDFRVKRAAG